MTAPSLGPMPPTVVLDLSLAAAIALVRRRRHDAPSYDVTKEELDHLHYDELATDAVLRSLSTREGEGHDRTRTQSMQLFVVGESYARFTREMRAVGKKAPQEGQRLAALGITYRVEGYTSAQGGNRHVLTITRDALDVLVADGRIGPRARYFAEEILTRRVRFPTNHPVAPRSSAARVASLRSKYKARAARLLSERGTPYFEAWTTMMLRVMRVTREKERVLRPSDVVAISLESLDAEERAGYKELRRRGLAHVLWTGRTPSLVANLARFRPYTLEAGRPLREALGWGAFRPPA